MTWVFTDNSSVRKGKLRRPTPWRLVVLNCCNLKTIRLAASWAPNIMCKCASPSVERTSVTELRIVVRVESYTNGWWYLYFAANEIDSIYAEVSLHPSILMLALNCRLQFTTTLMKIPNRDAFTWTWTGLQFLAPRRQYSRIFQTIL